MSVPALASPEAPSLREIVASEIRAQLARRKMTGRELARILREQQTWVSRRLNGSIPPTTDDIERICSAIGITPQRLMTSAFAAAEDADTGPDTRRYPTPSSCTGRVLSLVPAPRSGYADVHAGYGSSASSSGDDSAPVCVSSAGEVNSADAA